MIDADVLVAVAVLTWPGGSGGSDDVDVEGGAVEYVPGDLVVVADVVAADVAAADVVPLVLVAEDFDPEPHADTVSAATVTMARTADLVAWYSRGC